MARDISTVVFSESEVRCILYEKHFGHPPPGTVLLTTGLPAAIPGASRGDYVLQVSSLRPEES